MKVLEYLNGIIGVTNTPFTGDNLVDEDSLRRYIDYSIKSGVKGFLVLGMAAETNKLNHDEKTFIVTTSLDEVRNRVPVICSLGPVRQKERLETVKKIIDLGCQGIMVNIPIEDEDSFIGQIAEIDKLKPGFIMIQDWDFNGYGIPVRVIERLYKEIESFKCLKIEVAPAGLKYTEVRKVTKNKLHVAGGWAGTQMIEALDRGVNAFMPTAMHDIYVRIFDLHHSGKRRESLELFCEVVPILAFSHQHLDISIHFNKRLMHRLGLFSNHRVRDPILSFDEYHERIADELIDRAISISRRLSYQNQKNSSHEPTR